MRLIEGSGDNAHLRAGLYGQEVLPTLSSYMQGMQTVDETDLALASIMNQWHCRVREGADPVVLVIDRALWRHIEHKYPDACSDWPHWPRRFFGLPVVLDSKEEQWVLWSPGKWPDRLKRQVRAHNKKADARGSLHKIPEGWR